jgi:roadblock/LC7 domain-containing protein
MSKLTLMCILLSSFNTFASIQEVKLLDIYNTGDSKVVKFYANVDANNMIKGIFQIFNHSDTGKLVKEIYKSEDIRKFGAVISERMGKEIVIINSKADDYTGGELSLSYMQSAFSSKRGIFKMDIVPNGDGFEIRKNGVIVKKLCFVLKKKLGATIGIKSIVAGNCPKD